MRKIMQILPGLGLLLIVVGLIVYANGGGSTVGVIGVVVLAVAFVNKVWHIWDLESRAHWNRTKYWANGDEPDWKRNRK